MESLILNLEKMNSFLEQSLWFQAFKFFLGVYLIILILVVILVSYRLIKKYSYFKVLLGGQDFPVLSKGKFQSRWDKVEILVASNKPSDQKAAILLAAEMLNEICDIVGYKGETLGEKLKNLSSYQLNNLEQTKRANEIKNKIVQDERFQISQEDAEEMIKIFKTALQTFEAVN